jgi:hypothetical protein
MGNTSVLIKGYTPRRGEPIGPSGLIKSFCGVQGRYFQKEPLAAGGIN